MADTSSVTIQQLWQTPMIKGLYTELATPSMTLSGYYSVMSNREHTPTRVFGWDQFNLTRTVATMKAPLSGPSTIRRQRIATKTGALLRVAEKLNIYDDEIKNLRPPGTPIGTLDARGEAWFTRQVDFMTQRHRNLMEISTSMAIQGGFGLARSGEMYYLTELNASGNEFDIDMFQVENDATCRTRHTGDLNGIIDVPWDNPAADIIGQMQKLQQRMLVEYGTLSNVAWTDSRTIRYMMQNIGLQTVNGIANKVWQSWDANTPPREVKPSDRNLGGQRIVFGAMPHWTFLVNDAVVSLGTSEDPQGTDVFHESDGNLTRVIPAGHVIFTPPPGEWFKVYEGEECVRPTWNSDVVVAKGFYAWNFPLPPHPPGREANMLDNFLPVIVMPRAIWNAEVRTKEADEI